MIDWIRPNFDNSKAWELENCPLYHENPWLSSTNIKKRAKQYLKEAGLNYNVTEYDWIKEKFEK